MTVTVNSSTLSVTINETTNVVQVASPGPAGTPGSVFTPAADSGSGSAVSTSLTIAGTAPISTAVSGTTVTVSHDTPASASDVVTLDPSSITVNATGHVVAVGAQKAPLAIAQNLADLGNAATARTNLGVTNVGAYTGQIETAADKTYTIDPAAATARTISGFFIKSGYGTCTATLKVGSDTVKAASVSTSSGDQSSLANTSVSADEAVTIVISSNSSATDVLFSVEYTE
jgi:hypothetical protein